MSFTDHAPGSDELRTDEFVLRPIRVTDAELDYDAVMSSRTSLRLWEQSGWPADDFTLEANREDLVLLERRHAAGESSTFTVMDPTEDRCLGCVYVFPADGRQFARYQVTPVGDARWSEVEVGVYFWVRESRVADGLDRRLLDTLRVWFEDEWGLERFVVVTNERFEQQVEMLERAGLELRFELTSPAEPGRSRAYR